jgi:hypothetical protein
MQSNLLPPNRKKHKGEGEYQNWCEVEKGKFCGEGKLCKNIGQLSKSQHRVI